MVRIVTNPRAFRQPSALDEALAFAAALLDRSDCLVVGPGARHWEIFARLCRESGARGPLVPDAYFAALAIESGCEWITTDRDFARFKGLRWRHPLA
jgi:toxin-antitoxin system PIN domain toxin